VDREVLDGVRWLVESTRGHAHSVLISVGGRSVRFWSDHPGGIHVARTVLGPYCDVTELDGTGTPNGNPYDLWTVTSARVDGLAAEMVRLTERCAAASISPMPVRRWPGDFPSDRYDLADGYAVVVHWRPFVGMAVFSRDDRELHYLRPDSAFDVSNTEHVLKYPLRTMLRQAGLSQVHAAGCVFGGRGILIMGEKGSGKSTLLAQFMSRGAQQVSNDLSFVRVTSGGRLEMIAFPHITRMAPGTVMANKMLREGLAREKRTGDYLRSPVFNGGKEEFYFPVLERIWGKDPVCRLAPLDVVVFPAFDLECTATASEPLPDSERDDRIRQSLVDDPPLPDWLPFMSDAEFRSLAAAAAEALLQRDPPAYELRFGPDTADPVEEVERILERPRAPV
jgi:hypothetical protein